MKGTDEFEISETETQEQEIKDVKKLIVVDEIMELLNSENILEAISSFQADSDEKKTAIEFVNSHNLFLTELVGNDYKKNLIRSDIEIKDVVANINSMLKARDEIIFTAMVYKSTSHYRQIHTSLSKSQEDENGDKKE